MSEPKGKVFTEFEASTFDFPVHTIRIPVWKAEVTRSSTLRDFEEVCTKRIGWELAWFKEVDGTFLAVWKGYVA